MGPQVQVLSLRGEQRLQPARGALCYLTNSNHIKKIEAHYQQFSYQEQVLEITDDRGIKNLIIQGKRGKIFI